jgi:hypothetical protein
MAKSLGTKLNQLERDLPEGLVVDAAWLTAKGYSPSLRNQYVASGWLTKPAHTVYRRPRGDLAWQQVVISLQMLMGKHGRDSLVVMPVEEWERLRRRDRRVGLTSELPEEWVEAARNARVPEEFAHLDADLE